MLFKDRWCENLGINPRTGKEKMFNVLFLITCGNHDFDGRKWPDYPKIIDYINEGDWKKGYDIDTGPWQGGTYGEKFRYAYWGPENLLFISLGYGPRGESLRRSDRGFLGSTLPAAGTNEWLRAYLTNNNISRRQPIILFFHVPVTGETGGFMKSRDVDDFYNIIRGYNIKAIIVGHTHGNSSLNFRGFWQLDVSGTWFLHCAYFPRTDKLVCEWVSRDGKRERVYKPETQTESNDLDRREGYSDF